MSRTGPCRGGRSGGGGVGSPYLLGEETNGCLSRAKALGRCPVAMPRGVAMRPAMPPGPLHHLRVVDLTDLRGALAGRLLADLGADVVKVEAQAGDPDRQRPPFVDGRSTPDGSL